MHNNPLIENSTHIACVARADSGGGQTKLLKRIAYAIPRTRFPLFLPFRRPSSSAFPHFA